MSNNQDSVQRFLFDQHNVRGAIVHLNESFRTIISQYDYPVAIQALLGQTLLAAVMLSDMIKYEGQVTIQCQSQGPITLLVAKCNHEGHIRALARWDATVDPALLQTEFGKGELVITVERNDVLKPYQSIVPLRSQSVSQALTHYFQQSEQLPSHFLMTVSDGHAAGMMLQKMPQKESEEDETIWVRATEHLAKLEASELLLFDNEELLKKHFQTDDIRLFDADKIMFRCRCDVARMRNAVKTLGEEEAMAILEKKTRIVVTCDYCQNKRDFDREEVEEIFR